MEGLWKFVCVTAILIGIVWMIYSVTQVVKEVRRKNAFYKTLENIALQEMYNSKRAKLYALLNDLNMDYMLGLEDYEFEKILDAADMETAKKLIYFYMDKSPITLDIFQNNVLLATENILRGSDLTAERQEEIIGTIAYELSIVDDSVLLGIIEDFSSQLTYEYSFLRGRINYTLAALGILKQLADDESDMVLLNHVNNVRRKKGIL